MTLTVGSVCSGIGAPEVAWAPFGWDYLWHSEIAPFPAAVLAAQFQGVPNLGDMTTIAPRVLGGEVAAPDILVGGTPCQSFSVAGLRKGLADDRGNLALEFIRLADAIDAVRRAAGKPPAWILWENVPGVLSDPGNAFGAFLAGMVGGDASLVPRGRWTGAGVVHGPGRCAAWRILDAQHFGLAQRRERVFVLARGGAGAWSAADALLPVIESLRWHPAPRREAREAVARPIAASSAGSGGYRHDADTADNLVAGTLSARCGNGSRQAGEERGLLVPVAEIGKRTGASSRSLKAGDGFGEEGGPMFTLGADSRHGVMAWGGNNTSGSIGVAPALNACGSASGRQDFDSEAFITEVAPALQANGKAAGSATQQDAENGALIAHTLRAEGFDASEDGTGRGTPLVAVAATLSAGGHPNSNAPGRRMEDDVNLVADVGAAVRRLTPRECERLQGFPDDATVIAYRGKTAADGPRYRALGNSMAVPVLRWIGRRIGEEHANGG